MRKIWRGSINISLALMLAVAGCASDAQLTKKTEPMASHGESAKIIALSASTDEEKVELSIKADNPIQYTVFKMTDPLRLIVDMSQVDMAEYKNVISVDHKLVSEIRPLYFSSSNDSRLEVDLKTDADYRLDNDNPNELIVMIFEKGSAIAADTEKSANNTGQMMADTKSEQMVQEHMEPEPMDSMTVAGLVSQFNRLVNVEFKQINGISRIEVTMSNQDPAYQLLAREHLNRITLDLPGAVVAPEDERLININLDQSRIKNIAVFQFSGGHDPIAKVVVNLEGDTLYNISSEGSKIILDVGDEAVLALAVEVDEARQEELAKSAVDAPLDEPKYIGSKISLDFQNADIHNILRIIADVSGLNVITTDKVQGAVTIKLHNVPWDQALEVILKNSGLDMIREGNIIRVSTAAQIQAEKDAAKKLQDTEREIAPLFTKLFEVNYESVANMKVNLDSLKSERGTVEVNERTNMLIVTDTKKKLAEMQRLIKALDKKEMQVLIEARIIEVSHNHARQLGIQWGGFMNTVSSSNFPNTIGVTGGVGPSPNQALGGSLVNLPIAGPTGALGLTLGHVNGTALLDMKLMAMENSGKGRIVSMPRITTMNNKEAIIESGREIPYQTISSEGTKTEFKKAVLSLKVTPHITPDRHVRMNIQINKDEADFANMLPGGAPPIKTKQAKTEVLVLDGNTTVIGGLFTDTDQGSRSGVPGLASIPILGWLFKNDSSTRSGEELLIFITPKIVE